jgi:2,4-dichlorophenol 6-monooxygenase
MVLSNLSAGREVDTPVLIVGAGPAGLTASLLLSKYQIHHVVIEKYAGMAHTPRAHIINQRTVEILRDLGLEEPFRRIAMPWDLMRNTVFQTSLTGTELARRESWGTSPQRRGEYIAASPCQMANCGQHFLEPLLYQAAVASKYAEFLLNHEFVELSQSDDAICALVRERSHATSVLLRSKYLLGADGARSLVARQAGLNYEGEDGISASATIHFHADLSRYVAHRPGVLYWNLAPGAGGFRGLGTLICYQPWFDWAVAFSYRPEDQDGGDESKALTRLRAIIGDPEVDIEILNISKWTINRSVAEKYSLGRVLCMGDAVHRHPPFNGLGLNTSVADAYNLAWKLAMVLGGSADKTLLDTYNTERQPVGKQVVARANASIHDLEVVRHALGFEEDQIGEHAKSAVGRLFQPGPEGSARRDKLSAAVAGTDYQFNAHGVELGYRYNVGAIVNDLTIAEFADEYDEELYYRASTRPGCRLPHAWVQLDEQQVSTLDLGQGISFSLLSGVGGEPWREAARAATIASGVEINVYLIGAEDGPLDCYGDWRRLSGVSDSGCVLVRPDRHVAWRADSASIESCNALPDVVRTLVGVFL